MFILNLCYILSRNYKFKEVVQIKLNELKAISDNINLDEYIEFRESIKKEMKHPEWLGDFSKKDLINLINSNSKIFIYYLNKEPVCSIMLIPSDEDAISKFGLKLDYKEVVDYGPSFVNSKYRGYSLQSQMIKALDDYSRTLGYKYADSTIHPDNVYSTNNLIKNNFKYVGTKEFKRGIRNIYIKELDRK